MGLSSDSPFQARLTRCAATSSLAGLAGVQPPLAGQRDHADQRLACTARPASGRSRGASNSPAQDVLDLAGDVVDQRGERAAAPLATGRVAGQDPEAVGVLLDVGRAAPGRPARAAPAGGRAVSAEVNRSSRQLHLPVDDDRVQAFLAAEVLVDDRLADARPGRRSPRSRWPRSPSRRTARGRRRAAARAAPCRSCGRAVAPPPGVAHRRPGRPGVPRRPPSGPVRRQCSTARSRGDARPASRSGSRPLDVAGPAELLEHPDHPGADVDLARAARRAGRRSGRRGAGCASDSPKLRIASGQKFARLVAGRRTAGCRSMWQTELIDQVTWCSSAIRTSAGPEERRQRAGPGPA